MPAGGLSVAFGGWVGIGWVGVSGGCRRGRSDPDAGGAGLMRPLARHAAARLLRANPNLSVRVKV